MKTGHFLQCQLTFHGANQCLRSQYRACWCIRKGAYGIILLLLVSIILTGCQNYATGWQPYHPLAEAEMASPDSDNPSLDTDNPSTEVPSRDFAVWGETDTYAIEAFIKRHPELDVTYDKQIPADWQTLWTAALAAGTGPDV